CCLGKVRCGGHCANSKGTITENATTKARATFCYSHVAKCQRRSEGHRSAVTNTSAGFSSTTTEKPHEFFCHTGCFGTGYRGTCRRWRRRLPWSQELAGRWCGRYLQRDWWRASAVDGGNYSGGTTLVLRYRS